MVTIFGRLCPRKSRYVKLIKKAHIQVDKELDLQKFIYRSRTNVTALLGLLSFQQKLLVENMAKIVIHGSSDLEKTSEDDELNENFLQNLYRGASRMVNSKDKTDQRFVKIYYISKGRESRRSARVSTLLLDHAPDHLAAANLVHQESEKQILTNRKEPFHYVTQ